MSEVVNAIAYPKGWRYNRRAAKVERKHGYNFRSREKHDGRSYLCTIRADNPIDAANRLNPVETAIQKFLDEPN